MLLCLVRRLPLHLEEPGKTPRIANAQPTRTVTFGFVGPLPFGVMGQMISMSEIAVNVHRMIKYRIGHGTLRLGVLILALRVGGRDYCRDGDYCDQTAWCTFPGPNSLTAHRCNEAKGMQSKDSIRWFIRRDVENLEQEMWCRS